MFSFSFSSIIETFIHVDSDVLRLHNSTGKRHFKNPTEKIIFDIPFMISRENFKNPAGTVI